MLYAIALIGAAWLVQSLLGYWQIRHFNRRFMELRRQGRVAVGRLTGKWRAGTVVLIVFNRQKTILRAERMQGVTVFSRLKPLPSLAGKNLMRLSEQDLSRFDKLTAKAVRDAVDNVRTISKGGDVPIKQTWLERLFSLKTG